MIEQEKMDIIKSYIDDLKDTAESVAMLLIRLTPDKAVSNNNENERKRLEAEIEGIIASYKQKELAFRSNLISLYKKYNKPHPLKLEDIIKNKENEIKKYLTELQKEVKRIDKKIFEVMGMDPLVQTQYFDWSLSLNFDDLKRRYQELAKDPSKETSSQYQKQVVKALKQVIENR